jgi:soluble lytic murein transglycosylase-like protein
MRYPESITELKILVSQLPELHSLHFDIATLYLQEGRWQEAIDQLGRIPDVSPLSDTAKASLQVIYLTQAVKREANDDLAGAAELYNHAVHHGPFAADLWNKVGQILYESGDDSRAVKWFQQVLKQEPDNQLAHYYLGLINYRSGPETALEALIEEEQISGFHAGQYVRQLAAKFDIPLALIMALIRQESAMNPDADSGVAYGLMQLTEDTARNYGLRVDAEVDERKNPARNLEVGIRFLRYLLDEFGNNEADVVAAYNCGPGNIRIYHSQPHRMPDETKAHVYKVWYYYSRYTQSTAALQQALAKLTENCRDADIPPPEPVMKPEEEVGSVTQALEHFQQCPELPEALFNIALVYEAGKSYQQAIAEYENYLSQVPRENTAQARIHLAGCYLHMGEYAKAREQLLNLSDEQARKALGVVELLSGDDVAALEHLGGDSLLSTYALLRLHQIEDAQERLQSMTESVYTTHANAILQYLQELPPHRAGQQGAQMELLFSPRNSQPE